MQFQGNIIKHLDKYDFINLGSKIYMSWVFMLIWGHMAFLNGIIIIWNVIKLKARCKWDFCCLVKYGWLNVDFGVKRQKNKRGSHADKCS